MSLQHRNPNVPRIRGRGHGGASPILNSRRRGSPSPVSRHDNGQRHKPCTTRHDHPHRSCELTPRQFRASGASTAKNPPDTHIDDAANLIGNRACVRQSRRGVRRHGRCGGFVSQFIPAIGAYIAAVLPMLVSLLHELRTGMLVLIVIVIYQQHENYLLSPRVTAHTMEIHVAQSFRLSDCRHRADGNRRGVAGSAGHSHRPGLHNHLARPAHRALRGQRQHRTDAGTATRQQQRRRLAARRRQRLRGQLRLHPQRQTDDPADPGPRRRHR